MPNEPLALAIRPPPDAPSEDDYQAFCAALSQSARGRSFLAEYARRNRNADTAVLLAAIERIEAHLRADASAVQRLRDDLRMLLIAIRLARPEIDAADPATQGTQSLRKLLDLLERRIDAMAEERTEPRRRRETLGAMPWRTTRGTARAHLGVVPPPDEPELPIPSPRRLRRGRLRWSLAPMTSRIEHTRLRRCRRRPLPKNPPSKPPPRARRRPIRSPPSWR